MMQALFARHVEVVQVLSTRGNIPAEFRGRAIDRATARGHFEMLKILSTTGEYPQENREEAFEYAALTGDIELVKHLLSGGGVKTGTLDRAAFKALKMNNLELLAVLLEIGDISVEARDSMVKHLAMKEHLNLVGAILADGDISVKARGLIVFEVCSRGRQHENYEGIVRALLFPGARILDEHYEAIVREVYGQKWTSLLEFLLNSVIGVRSYQVQVIRMEYRHRKGWRLPSSDLKANPRGILSRIETEGFPKKVTFTEGKALDAGGLSKQFVNQLSRE